MIHAAGLLQALAPCLRSAVLTANSLLALSPIVIRSKSLPLQFHKLVKLPFSMKSVAVLLF